MRTGLLLLTTTLIAAAFAGCLDSSQDLDLDEGGTVAHTGPDNSHPAYGFPVYMPINGTLAGNWSLPPKKELPSPMDGVEFVEHTTGTATGGGIAVFGTLAFIGVRTGQGPMQIVDISDPEAPEVVGTAPVPVRDADTIAYPDGRLVVITTAGGTQQWATDVTDPANPVVVADGFEVPGSNHNIAVVPGTPIVYNSGGGIADYSDPSDPEIVDAQTPAGCHDITFYLSQAEDKYRAYCAGYEVTGIWDITDPLAPTSIIDIPYPSVNEGLPEDGGPVPDLGPLQPSFSHLAMVNHDATVLIMGDETGGGALNGCDYYVEGPDGQTMSGPAGNLWFYDITDETDPILHGHVSPSFVDGAGGSCTAHFGRVIEDSGFLVMGFYAAGVVLVDYTDLDNPRITGRYDPPPEARIPPSVSPGVPPSVDTGDTGASIWDVWYYQGYLFTGDMNRGMDVLTFS
jgi:hypothetical protein